jgi:hypothetical protein
MLIIILKPKKYNIINRRVLRYNISLRKTHYILSGRLKGISSVPEAMWIGANDIDIESGWKWTDGQPFAYLNWAQGNTPHYKNMNFFSKVEMICAIISIHFLLIKLKNIQYLTVFAIFSSV